MVGVKSYKVVGWTHDADVWCNGCAEEMNITNDKPREEMGEEDGWPVFADSEWDYQPHCGGCGSKIPHVTVLDW
jgi:hypothetical protein